MPIKTARDYRKDYTQPELRAELKEKIKKGTKGGKAGRWSARKSQLLTKSYEQHGGGYVKNHRTKAQKNLQQWTAEDWQTSGHQVAIRAGKTTRYLPKEVWDKLSTNEKKVANRVKVQQSRQGTEKVANTIEAKKLLQQVHAKHRK